MTAFRIKSSLVAIPVSEHVSLSDEDPLLETLEFFSISYGSYQPLNFLHTNKYIYVTRNLNPFRAGSVFYHFTHAG